MTAPAESLTNPETWALSDCAKTLIDVHRHINKVRSNAKGFEVKRVEYSLALGFLRPFIVRASCGVRLSIFFILLQKISKRIIQRAIRTRSLQSAAAGCHQRFLGRTEPARSAESSKGEVARQRLRNAIST